MYTFMIIHTSIHDVGDHTVFHEKGSRFMHTHFRAVRGTCKVITTQHTVILSVV